MCENILSESLDKRIVPLYTRSHTDGERIAAPVSGD
jgi:hypothetical protein